MKCTAILALATGAYAVQDTTPPVISLNMATTNAHVARECAVFSTVTACPDPVCGAHDHHDGALACTTEVKMINDDGATSGASITAAYTTADRNVRSEWLYKYDASDKSGNAAETVTFELTIFDHVDPILTVSAPWDVAAITSTTNYQAQSCNMGNSKTVYTNAAPCTWPVLASSASAVDAYDASNMQIKNSVTAPGQTATIANLADHNIDTQKLGEWKLHWQVCDNAAQYGVNGADNCVSKDTSVTIADTWKPILTLKATTNADTYECGQETYVEHGAFCKDLRSSMNGGAFDALHMSPVIDSSAVKVKLENAAYTVTYDCKDELDQAAVQITRSVKVVDTTNPTIGFGSNVDTTIENSAGAAVSTANTHEGSTGLFDATYLGGSDAYTCTDECYDAPVTVATLHYGGDCTGNLVGTDGALTNFPEYTAGDYSIKYVCTDKPTGGLSSSICRKIQNVDHTRPVIQILGSDEMTLEATHEGNYIDDGATCSDQVDGVISQNVEVSGDVVNLSKVGAYTITYNCKDSAGNTAPTLSRKVHVKQTSCPTCVITGPDTLTHEASFPYTDEGALCTDIIDGRVDTIVANDVDVQITGVYTVTYRAQNSVGLYNDGLPATGPKTDTSGCRGTAVSYTRTVTVKDTLKPVIHLSYEGEGNIAWGSAGPKANNLDQFKGTDGTYDQTHLASTGGLMAEEASTSSVNGWVLGAVASAVTGLALLGFSQRKTTVATSVPV